MKKFEIKPNESEINKIHNLDCFELFRQMKEKNIEVDAIITDPPYDLDLVNKKNFAPSVLERWDDDFNQLNWIKEVAPLVKKGGTAIIFNHWKNLSEINQELERSGFVVKDLIRWVKPNPLWKSITKEYTTDYELAIWAVKGNDEWTFNFEKQLIRNLENRKDPCIVPEYVGDVVIGGERIHPTQKNLQVIKDIIELHTKVGDLVLDPFMGSGTTAVACKELGRDFIGSEIDENYFQEAESRLKKLNLQDVQEHKLDEESLQTLIKETEVYIENLEKEITTGKNNISNDKKDEYGMTSRRLGEKEKVKNELEKVVRQWEMKLSRMISRKQKELTKQILQEPYGASSSSKNN